MNKYCKALELDKVLLRLSKHCCCADSRAMALAVEPADNLRDVRALMRFTSDANALTNRSSTPSIGSIENCSGALKRASIGAQLSPRELLDVARVLRAIETIERWGRQLEGDPTSLDILLGSVVALPTLQRNISATILSEDEIADNASPELSEIRRKIRQSGARAREVLDRMVRSATYQKFLQENIITQRDGRFVVPVKIEYRNEIKGLVHDTSASGSTVFIEPMGVVEANNEIRLLQSREQAEIRRILQELSAQVGGCAESIKGSYEAIVELDLYFAKSRLADEMHATIPNLNENGVVFLKKARHPLIEKDKVVPIELRLGDGFDTLVVTGPNTGGKTVALKTVALCCMLAGWGLHVPCREARVCMNSQYLCDIGDGQNLAENLSTFSAHITNVLAILRQVNEESLVIMDELGSGTDPTEGMGIAIAILEALRQSGCLFLVTTHYPEVKEYAAHTPGVINARMTFDRESLRPLYQMVIGEAGASCAFAIAERLGMPRSMLDIAEKAAYGNPEDVHDLGGLKRELARGGPRIQRDTSSARQKDLSHKFRRGDSVMLSPDYKIGIVCEPVNDKGCLRVQLPDRKIWINHKRVKLHVAADRLYPPDYDFSIVFDTVENRKKRHDMERKYMGEVTIEYEE